MNEMDVLKNQAAKLKVAFEEAILKGLPFTEVKKIYIELKDLEKRIHNLQQPR